MNPNVKCGDLSVKRERELPCFKRESHPAQRWGPLGIARVARDGSGLTTSKVTAGYVASRPWTRVTDRLAGGDSSPQT